MKAECFRGKYDFLSNFYPVTVYGYPSIEHAYQAAKTVDKSKRARIKACKTAAEAKQLGRSFPLREDWEEIKIDVMETLVRRKFEKPSLRYKLLEISGDIEEGNRWHDNFWGICKCGRCHSVRKAHHDEASLGRNELGKILMKVRSEIKNQY